MCAGLRPASLQVAAIAENIGRRLRNEAGRKPAHIEGLRRSEWVLMDYIDFVVHVFVEPRREFYRLERLWDDAARVDVSPEDARRPGGAEEASAGGSAG